MDAELRARLAAVLESTQAAEASAARDATTGMEAVLESCKAMELLVEKDAVATSKKRKQLAEMKEIVTDFWKNKAELKSRELELLEAKLSAAAARNGQLESEVQASKKSLVEAEAAFEAEKAKMELELDGLSRTVGEIKAEKDAAVAKLETKLAAAAVSIVHLESEVQASKNSGLAEAEAAFKAEKAKMKLELNGLRMVYEIKGEKDASVAIVHQKEAEEHELLATLQPLVCTMMPILEEQKEAQVKIDNIRKRIEKAESVLGYWVQNKPVGK